MKIPGLPPEVDAALDRVNDRLTAAVGDDPGHDDPIVSTDRGHEHVCRAMLSGELEPEDMDGVLVALENYAVGLHHAGHQLPCEKHEHTIQVGLTVMFLFGRFLGGGR